MKRKISAILLISMLASLAACGDNAENPVETTPGNESESTSAAEYDFGNHDFGGDEFNILNGSNTWSMYSSMDFEEQTGEPLDDAIYNRNRQLEDLYKFRLVVTEKQQDTDLLPEIRKFISAGEDIYDVVYLGSNLAGAVVSEGYYLDLNKVNGFNFDKEYWDQSVISEGTIGKNNALYFASSPAQLMNCEGAWIMYFNERMLKGLGLDTPYQLVRDGKWTLDELGKYMKAGADLNGDESFSFSVDGKAIYGLTSSYAFPSGCITAAGISYISKDKDRNPYFSLESDRFYTLADKLASMFAKEGEYVSRNNAGKDHYEEIFKAGRALFLGAELKAAGKLRYYGLSNIHGDGLEELLPYAGRFACCQDELSLACRKNEDDLRAVQSRLRATPMTWGSLGQGILTGKYNRENVCFGADDRRSREIYVNFHGEKLEQNLRIVEALKKIAANREKSVAACAIRWILDTLPESVVIAGVKRPAQLSANVEAMGWTLNEEELRELNEVSE